MPKRFIRMPQAWHVGLLGVLLEMIGTGRFICTDVLDRCDVLAGMLPGAQQETLDAFDELVAAGQMPPTLLEIEELALCPGIVGLVGAPPAVGRARMTCRNVRTQLLEHHHATCFK